MKDKLPNRLIGWFFLLFGVFSIAAGVFADVRSIQLGSRRSGSARLSPFQIEGAGVVMVIIGMVALRNSKKK